MFGRFPLYPFLLSVVPVLALFQNNPWIVPPIDMVRPALLSLLTSGATYAVLHMATGKRFGGAVLAALFGGAIYAYPVLFSGFYSLWPGVGHGCVLTVWFGIVALVVAMGIKTVRRRSSEFKESTAGLNAFALVLGFLVLGQAAYKYRQTSAGPAASNPSTVEAERQGGVDLQDPWGEQALSAVRGLDADRHPDIYYIILDGYARNDILESRFHYRNQELLDWLKERGFFIVEKSHANYTWTHLCLAATLNLGYLQDLLPPGYARDAPTEYRSRYMYFVGRLGKNYILKNRVFRFLEALGYQVIVEGPGYAVTRPNVSGKQALLGPLTCFEKTLLRKTVFWPLVESLEIRASLLLPVPTVNRNLQLLRQLPDEAEKSSPKFVFYHVLAPHAPFVFTEKGDIVHSHPVFERSSWLVDGLKLRGFQDYYLAGYRNNVAGLNVHVKVMLENLLQTTRGQAVIILQSDHGSNLNLNPFHADKSDVPERFGILNAIYMPPRYVCAEWDATLSAVNTFRMVFNCVFGLDLVRLEDRAWFSIGDLEFTEVTERLE